MTLPKSLYSVKVGSESSRFYQDKTRANKQPDTTTTEASGRTRQNIQNTLIFWPQTAEIQA
jgi:hypothetical protein